MPAKRPRTLGRGMALFQRVISRAGLGSLLLHRERKTRCNKLRNLMILKIIDDYLGSFSKNFALSLTV
jgi:hypothetical protein